MSKSEGHVWFVMIKKESPGYNWKTTLFYPVLVNPIRVFIQIEREKEFHLCTLSTVLTQVI